MTVAWLNDSAPVKIFAGKEFELLLFDKRISFLGKSRPTFSSAYFCHRFLTDKLILEQL